MKTATPESQGIRSEAIIDLLTELEGKGLAMHSLLVARHGVLVSESYWKPFTGKSLQRMYSVTKSLVSMAIGILVHQHKISLDDPVCGYFPEKLPKQPSEALLGTSIRDMLRMESCHKKTTYKLYDNPDWVGSFFTVPVDHQPGSFFLYDTSATHVLGALVEKLTGKELLDFLRDELLSGTEFSREACTLKDPMGVTQGGSGLLCTSRDLLVLAQTFTDPQNPCHDYFQEASSKQVETWPDAAGGLKDLQEGYGYYVWRTTHQGFCFYGMGGQLALFVPGKQLVIVTTAWLKHTQGGLQELFDSLWDLVDSIGNEPLSENPGALTGLRAMEEGRELRVAPGTSDVACGLGSYTLPENETGIRSVVVTKKGNELLVTVNDTYHGIFGIGSNRVGPFLFNPEWQAACSAAMDCQKLLRLHVQLLGPELGDMTLLLAPGSVRMTYCVEPAIPVRQGVSFATFREE
ncbi:MAG: serine hydrolase domain-containing protein [Sphaerochaetaceae bacterium]|nr:serine hydrolase [Spirochaetales bacterium]MDY5499919.1 serine hydrolase domain-containing protein [Sphaerochaetaceae bacterium]